MRPVNAGLKTHYGTEVRTTCNCWKLTRADGVVMGFTDHDAALVISGVTYQPASGFARSAISARADLSVDTTDVTALLDSVTITEADLIAGVYDNDLIELFSVNRQDLTQGTVMLGYGRLGNVTTHRGTFRAEVRSLSQKLQQTIGERNSSYSRAEHGKER